MPTLLIRRMVLAAACLAGAACAERPRIGVEIGSPAVKDCVPGSVSRPCG